MNNKFSKEVIDFIQENNISYTIEGAAEKLSSGMSWEQLADEKAEAIANAMIKSSTPPKQ